MKFKLRETYLLVTGPRLGRIFSTMTNSLYRFSASRTVSALLLLCLVVVRSTNAANENDVLVEFKAMLQARRPIKSVVFTRIFYENGKPVSPNSQNANGGRIGEENFKLYFGQWQTNGFFFRDIKTIDDIKSSNPNGSRVFAGGYGDDYWCLEQNLLQHWKGRPQDFAKDKNSVTIITTFSKSLLSEVLTLGAFQAQPGTIEWVGNDFKAFSKENKVIKGRLILGEDQKPVRLEYSLEAKDFRSSIAYTYTNDLLPAFCPSVVTISCQTKQLTGNPHLQLVIHSLEISEGEMPKEAFSAQAHIAPRIAQGLEEARYFNGKCFLVDKNGSMTPMPSLKKVHFYERWLSWLLPKSKAGPNSGGPPGDLRALWGIGCGLSVMAVLGIYFFCRWRRGSR